MLAGAWPGASGMACAALPDNAKMKARATSLFIRFSLICCYCALRSWPSLGYAVKNEYSYLRENLGIDSANPLKHTSRSSCSLMKRQSITPLAAGGFGLGFGGMMAS
jgi:hypothetical protein